MKTPFIVELALCVSLSFFSCAKKSNSAKDGRPTIRFVTSETGVDDKSFNAAVWNGILEFYGDAPSDTKSRGTFYDVIICQTQDQYVPVLKQLSDEGYDLICATGSAFADAISEVAEEYPEQRYMIVDINWIKKHNVKEFIFKEEEGSYLVGMAAALQALEEGVQNPIFGFIGGFQNSTITRFEMGYFQGVRAIIPNAQIVDYYANSWGSPQLAKTQAKTWYDNGVYAIFSAAGGTGSGTIDQAKESQMEGKNVWAIGVDCDQYEDGVYAEGKSAVLTSMIKRAEVCPMLALKEIAAGGFIGGAMNLSLKFNGLDYSKQNSALSEATIEKLEAAKKDIGSGEIKVYGEYKEALAAGVVSEGLGAIDD